MLSSVLIVSFVQLLGHILLLLPPSRQRAKYNECGLHIELLLAHVRFHRPIHWPVSRPVSHYSVLR
jgi:hypothetical protein